MTSTSQEPGGWPFANLLHLRAKSSKVEPHAHEFSWAIADAINKIDEEFEDYRRPDHLPDGMYWNEMSPGDWHLPYVEPHEVAGLRRERVAQKHAATSEPWRAHDEHAIERTAALASAMRCARSSYNKLDGAPATLEEDAQAAIERLLDPNDLHGSPFEHQARAVARNTVVQVTTFETAHRSAGLTRQGLQTETKCVPYRSGNLVGWDQFRHVLAQESGMACLRAGGFTSDDYAKGRKRILRNDDAPESDVPDLALADVVPRR